LYVEELVAMTPRPVVAVATAVSRIRGSSPVSGEQDGFAHTHRLEDYARQLGYSVRTLTRASHVATGYGAKHVIEERVLLAAKRLLVPTDLAITAVAARVGMPDPAAFGKFFRRQTGEAPATFRGRVRGDHNSS
jgi:transcriptional regulator GlxA family with amidase domain